MVISSHLFFIIIHQIISRFDKSIFLQFHKELERLITGENIETTFLSDNQFINIQIIRRQSDNQDYFPYLTVRWQWVLD